MHHLKIDLTEKLKTLDSNVFFQGLSAASLRELTAAMSLRRFERGEVLFWEGDPCNEVPVFDGGMNPVKSSTPQASRANPIIMNRRRRFVRRRARDEI